MKNRLSLSLSSHNKYANTYYKNYNYNLSANRRGQQNGAEFRG